MRHNSIFLLFVFITIFLIQPSFAIAEPIRFALLPTHNEGHVRREFYPFIKYLESVRQQPVKFSYRNNYKDIIDGLMADEIDLALLGPLPFALISQQDPDILPMLHFLNSDGSTGYTCSIGVFIADHLQKDALKNKQFALTQPYSTCGFLMTEHLLNQQGLSLAENQFEYIGNHPDSALSVIDGKAAACGIKTSIGKQFNHLGLRLIAESEVVPNFVLVANQRTLNATTIDVIRQHLLALKPLKNRQDAELTDDWGELIRYGSTPVNIDDFNIVINLLNRIHIPGVSK